jgi:CHAT domain-containing protein
MGAGAHGEIGAGPKEIATGFANALVAGDLVRARSLAEGSDALFSIAVNESYYRVAMKQFLAAIRSRFGIGGERRGFALDLAEDWQARHEVIAGDVATLPPTVAHDPETPTLRKYGNNWKVDLRYLEANPALASMVDPTLTKVTNDFAQRVRDGEFTDQTTAFAALRDRMKAVLIESAEAKEKAAPAPSTGPATHGIAATPSAPVAEAPAVAAPAGTAPAFAPAPCPPAPVLSPAAQDVPSGSVAAYIQEIKDDLCGPASDMATLQKRVSAALGHALNAFDLHSDADRLAFLSLGDDFGQRGDLSEWWWFFSSVLRQLAKDHLSPHGRLADRYAWLYARAAVRTKLLFERPDVAQYLVARADDERLRDEYGMAAFLYRIALRWTGGRELLANTAIRDRTPTTSKLAETYLKLGYPSEADTLLASDPPPSAQDLCVMVDSIYRGERQVLHAEALLANHHADQALATLHHLLHEWAACADQSDTRRDVWVARALGLTGRAYWASGDAPHAFEAFARFADNYERLLERNLVTLSEQMAVVPAVILQSDTDIALAFLATRDDEAAARLAVQILTSRTGRLLEMAGDRSRLYRDPKYNAAEIFRLRAERGTLLFRGMLPAYAAMLQTVPLPDSLSPRVDIPPVDQAIGQLAYAEDELSWRVGSAPTPDAFVVHPVSLDDIFRAQEDDTAILCYVLVPRIDPWTNHLAGTDIVTWTIGRSQRVEKRLLGDVDVIKALINEYLGVIRGEQARISPDDPSSRARREALLETTSHALFTRLLANWPNLVGLKHITIIPDGPVNWVPFAALATDSGKKLIEESDIGYESSLREIVRERRSTASVQTPVLIAASALASGETQSDPDDHSPITPPLQPLPGAEREIQAIGTLLGPDTKQYRGEGATEALVKSLVSPSILHIAAHGIYVPEGNDARLDHFQLTRTQPNGLGTGGTRIANPLFHGYLAMAEYDKVRPLDQEDGILTDAEILGLDLEGTDLVVASGCSTGRGLMESGYGVFSMRAAFSYAGAKTQIVSLWSVDDEATALLMKRFYQLLMQRVPKIEAFSQAQREMARPSSEFRDPYYWAAFTPSGEDHTLAIVAQDSLPVQPTAPRRIGQ